MDAYMHMDKRGVGFVKVYGHRFNPFFALRIKEIALLLTVHFADAK